MIKIVLLSSTLLWSTLILVAQQPQRWNVPIKNDGIDLKYPLAGGLNTPQFSVIDFNQDSLSDLFVFDRSGGKILAFLNNGDNPQTYRYAPEYESIFPTLDEWALLKDFNNDSIADIFTFSKTGVPGIDVYRGRISSNGYAFDRISFDNPVKVLGYPTSTGVITNIYVSAIDIPDFADYDGDGDIDILSFESDGSKMHYYRNVSLEEELGVDSLSFILEDKCWGKVVESFNTNEVILSDDPDICPSLSMNARLHAGSTIASFDPDLDGVRDILLGDFAYETLLFLANGGSNQKAFITSQTQNFPDYDIAVSIPFFPAAFFNDYDGDGIPDMISCPNQVDARENIDVVWYYKGSENNGINFQFQKSDLLVGQMLDFGTDAAPMLLDVNGDGLQDLIVGSRFHKGYNEEHPSQLFLYLNQGTEAMPSFALADDNWLNIPSLLDESDMLYPTCGDIDDDGDDDLIIGNKRGKLLFIENLSISGGPFDMGSTEFPWFDIDVGFSSAPSLADVDGDGVTDLLVGEERGNINFFRNNGSVFAPVFNPDPEALENDESFGGIDARQNLAVFGLSSPAIVHSNDSVLLVVGTAVGNFLLYHLDGNYSKGDVLAPLSENRMKIREGERSKVAFTDLDENGFFDAIAGNSRGGISLFRTGFRVEQMVASTDYDGLDFRVNVFPNPAVKQISVETNFSTPHGLRIIDPSGKVWWNGKGHDIITAIDVTQLPQGLFFLEITQGNQTQLKSWIKL